MVDQASIKNFMWESIKETFETMISLPIEKTDEEGNKLDPSASLICTITFTGPLQGVFGVQCCTKGAEKIAKAMLMAGPDDPISEAEICDALGEVTNILIGGIKGKMSGAEMIHRMKADNATKSIPVVVVSTESRTSRIKELLGQGVKDYLHKPFTPEEFKEIIHGLWNKTPVEVNNLLTEALTQALETMAFLTVMPIEDDMAIPEKSILAEISFAGPKRGMIQILAGVGFARVLAENIASLKMLAADCFCLWSSLRHRTCSMLPSRQSKPPAIRHNGMNSQPTQIAVY
ncbi:hypothetical protein ES703_114601 [subsurface metagenome]